MTTGNEHSEPDPTAGVIAPAAVVDPVCGMTVAADTPRRIGHAGAMYVFCSA